MADTTGDAGEELPGMWEHADLSGGWADTGSAHPQPRSGEPTDGDVGTFGLIGAITRRGTEFRSVYEFADALGQKFAQEMREAFTEQGIEPNEAFMVQLEVQARWLAMQNIADELQKRRQK